MELNSKMICLTFAALLFLGGCTHVVDFHRIRSDPNSLNPLRSDTSAVLIIDEENISNHYQLFTFPWHTIVHADAQMRIKDALLKKLKRVFASVRIANKSDIPDALVFRPSLSLNYHYYVFNRSCEVRYSLTVHGADLHGPFSKERLFIQDSGLNWDLNTMCLSALDSIFDDVNDTVIRAAIAGKT